MIECNDIQKNFGDHTVLTDASFSVDPGTITALVGPNGSGKTTTLHILAGLTRPDVGTATVAGVNVTSDRTAAQEHLAFLPQDVRFHSALTPRQVLRFYAGLRGAPTDRIDDLLEDVALTGASDRPSGTLSGGMRQRLGLAVLELANASVLLLDEPALSLDPEWRTFLMDRLQAYATDGAAVLLATHLLDVWSPIVDRVLQCENGEVLDGGDDTGPVVPSANTAVKHSL